MDGKRFDDITKSIANRRGFLKGLTGAAAGLVGAKASGVLAACRPGGYACQRDADCCSAKCYEPSATSRNRVCCTPTQTDAQICSGKVCGTYTNSCGQSISCGTCRPSTNICVQSVTCNAQGQCVPTNKPDGTSCGECQVCKSGTCTPLKTNGSICSAASECCSGHCTDGICCSEACDGRCETCATGVCRRYPNGDGADTPPLGQVCCNGEPCYGECNRETGACICTAENGVCDVNQDCCSGMTCVGGKCCHTDNQGQCCLSPKQLCKGGVCCQGFCDGNGECCPSPPNLSHGCNGGTCCAGDCDRDGNCCPTNDGSHFFCGSGNCCTASQTCCDGQCCDYPCDRGQEEVCCDTGMYCDPSTGAPPGNQCCENPDDYKCCGDAGCCAGQCSNGGDKCCPHATSFVCPHTDTCCLKDQNCCTFTGCCSGSCNDLGLCCPTGSSFACGNNCCDNETQKCCNGQCIDRNLCCPSLPDCGECQDCVQGACVNKAANTICGDGPDDRCCDGVCKHGVDGKTACCVGEETPCGRCTICGADGFCAVAPDQTVCGLDGATGLQQVCCGNGNACCAPGQQCCDGICVAANACCHGVSNCGRCTVCEDGAEFCSNAPDGTDAGGGEVCCGDGSLICPVGSSCCDGACKVGTCEIICDPSCDDGSGDYPQCYGCDGGVCQAINEGADCNGYPPGVAVCFHGWCVFQTDICGEEVCAGDDFCEYCDNGVCKLQHQCEACGTGGACDGIWCVDTSGSANGVACADDSDCCSDNCCAGTCIPAGDSCCAPNCPCNDGQDNPINQGELCNNGAGVCADIYCVDPLFICGDNLCDGDTECVKCVPPNICDTATQDGIECNGGPAAGGGICTGGYCLCDKPCGDVCCGDDELCDTYAEPVCLDSCLYKCGDWSSDTDVHRDCGDCPGGQFCPVDDLGWCCPGTALNTDENCAWCGDDCTAVGQVCENSVCVDPVCTLGQTADACTANEECCSGICGLGEGDQCGDCLIDGDCPPDSGVTAYCGYGNRCVDRCLYRCGIVAELGNRDCGTCDPIYPNGCNASNYCS